VQNRPPPQRSGNFHMTPQRGWFFIGADNVPACFSTPKPSPANPWSSLQLNRADAGDRRRIQPKLSPAVASFKSCAWRRRDRDTPPFLRSPKAPSNFSQFRTGSSATGRLHQRAFVSTHGTRRYTQLGRRRQLLSPGTDHRGGEVSPATSQHRCFRPGRRRLRLW